MLNNSISKKMKLAGMTINYKIFIYMRLVSSAILFFLLLFFSTYGYLIAPIVTIIYYFFIEYVVLDVQIHKRKSILELDALDYFPILLLCLKGNNNVKNAITLTSRRIDSELSNEFKKVVGDVKLGKSLDESLILLKDRIPSTFICNIIVNLIEANRMGTSVSDSIIDQVEYINDKRKKKIVKYLSVMPLKVAIVSMAFVCAMLFLLIFCSL
jgi:tight adherence protein C